MPDGQVLEFTNVTKRFNEVTAVSDFSARVEPGAVTAFLGPNGAGKTTSLRILLGQIRATSGTATIGGTAYAELRQPLRTIGAVLEETAYRPRRTANRQLTIAAKANGIPLSRVDEVLTLVGLEGEGDTRIGGYSLGMRQRLSVAHALLGDPGALVFDEPANGLDPEGIRWMRLLMRRLADEGRTVLVSSHLLSEVEQVADNVLVLSKGHLVLASGIEKLADPKAGSVVVDAADRDALTAALSAAGFDVEVLRSGLTVRGGDAGTVGAVAAAAGIALSTLVQRGPTLEDVFMDLVRGGKLRPRVEAAASQLVAPESSEPVEAVAIGAEGGGTAGSDEASHDIGTDTDSGTPSSESAATTDDDAVQVSLVEEITAAASTSEAPEQQDAEPTAARSFDEILFGAASASAETPASSEAHHGVAAIFEDSEASAASATRDETPEPGEVADESSPTTDEIEPVGVEVFAELSETDAPAEARAESTDDDPTQAGDDDPAQADDDDDPRSAAVSSMLAAAARAYYDDEPKDYPLDGAADAEAGRQWAVASTGVIDTVPSPEPVEASEDHEGREDHGSHDVHGSHDEHGAHDSHEEHHHPQ